MWLAAIGVDVHSREALAVELVGNDFAGGVERRARLVRWRPGPSDPSRCPGRACIAAAPVCRRLSPARRHPWRSRRHRCGRRSRDPSPRSRRTLSSGTSSVSASPSCTKCDFCVPLQQVTLPSLISTSAQAGPILACDWNGHSYSASITLAAVLNASSTLPFSCSTCALAHRRLADVIVERGLFRERRR